MVLTSILRAAALRTRRVLLLLCGHGLPALCARGGLLLQSPVREGAMVRSRRLRSQSRLRDATAFRTGLLVVGQVQGLALRWEWALNVRRVCSRLLSCHLGGLARLGFCLVVELGQGCGLKVRLFWVSKVGWKGRIRLLTRLVSLARLGSWTEAELVRGCSVGWQREFWMVVRRGLRRQRRNACAFEGEEEVLDRL